MTNLQRLQLRLSEVRTRLNEISGLEGDAFTDEIRTEAATLQTEYSDLELKHRAAITGSTEEGKVKKLMASMPKRANVWS